MEPFATQMTWSSNDLVFSVKLHFGLTLYPISLFPFPCSLFPYPLSLIPTHTCLLFGPKFSFGPEFFYKNLFWPTFILTKNYFWTKKFWDPKFLRPKFFRLQIFWNLNFLGPKFFSEPKFFLGPKFFLTQMNFNENDLLRDKTELLNLRLSKLPTTEVLFKLESC